MGEGALVDIFEERSLLSSAVTPRTNFDLEIALPSHIIHDPHICKMWEREYLGGQKSDLHT